MAAGTLFIVATPIGNLEDITYRAVRTLKEVDLIAAEDTRHSRKLLTHFGISKPLTSYYDHNQQLKGQQILTALAAGKNVALISDAGTPGISDPGFQLLREAVAQGVTVVPIPGASAVITALAAGGLPTDSFTFIGFLPNKQGKRRERIVTLQHEQRVLVFYEAPQRLAVTLTDLADLPLNRYPHFVLLPRIWQLRHNLTAYDAAYLALAEALDAPLVTRDRALASVGGVLVELL